MKKCFLIVRTVLLLAATSHACYAQVDTKWKIHDPDRPLPPAIEAGTASTQNSPGRPPSDAVVLFDGKDLSQWQSGRGSWKVADGYLQVVPGAGDLATKQKFGDVQLHVEWASPPARSARIIA